MCYRIQIVLYSLNIVRPRPETETRRRRLGRQRWRRPTLLDRSETVIPPPPKEVGPRGPVLALLEVRDVQILVLAARPTSPHRRGTTTRLVSSASEARFVELSTRRSRDLTRFPAIQEIARGWWKPIHGRYDMTRTRSGSTTRRSILT